MNPASPRARARARRDVIPTTHHQLRFYNSQPNQDWEHDAKRGGEHQRFSCEHHISFPDRGHQQQWHQVWCGSDLYHVEQTTTVHFQYGRTTSYGSTTANQTKTGNTMQNVAANISGLTAGTTYHFRIVATNSAGTSYGSDKTFTTPSAPGPPVVTTNP